MKLITLIYQSKNITDSINIKLFFELAGIYVYEIQSDIKINISNQDKILSLSDAIICLDDDYLNNTYKQYNKYIIYKSLSDTIEYCLKNNLIDKYEYDDLISLYKIFSKHNKHYIKSILLNENYCKHRDKKYIKDIYNNYAKISSDILEILKQQQLPLWDDKDNDMYIHCKYAVVYMFFYFNLFCKKNKLDYYMDNKSIINICEHNINQLGNSFKIVEARIYDSLIEKPQIAFQIYNECCNNIYDSYVYLYKAEIMSKENSIDRAIDYYNKSIYINPQYYMSISKLAFCYLKKQSFFVAYNYYNTVIIILKNKAKSDNLNIMDYHYIYNACINMIKIDIILDNYRSALALCTYALEIYKSINQNKFYSKFKIDCAYVRKDIISVLNIDMLKKHGIELSTEYGLFDLCKEFSKL